MGRAHVVVHVAVSLDGSTTGFEPDQARFYELAATWHEHVTLVGADTILAQEAALATAPTTGPAAEGPLLAVVDGRRRVRAWSALRNVGLWSDVLALRCSANPGDDPAVEELVLGEDRVDLAAAIESLTDRVDASPTVIRVDSGGTLTGALLDGGLVDEVSLLLHPLLVGASRTPWYGTAAHPARLTPTATDRVGELVWARDLRSG
jgi:2,5-diamino-6-(ribosylamino)-4(3H)-pyrimidinone 5'-phosphate reductase